MSGRALRYFTQPMRSELNVGSDQHRSHPEPRKLSGSKDPAGLALDFATGFLDFARNDRKGYAQTNSRSLGGLSRLAPFKCR